MSIRPSVNQIRMQQWAAVIQKRAESGLSIENFCVANNISKNAYYYWLRKLRTTAIESASPRFVELPAPKDETVSTQPVNGAPPAHGMIEISLNDAVLKINGSVSRDLLSIVIGVLKDA